MRCCCNLLFALRRLPAFAESRERSREPSEYKH